MDVDGKDRVSRRDAFQKLRDVATTFASIAVPLVIAWVGWQYNAAIKDSENRLRYVELAIAQLRSAPTPETQPLREWAVELLDSQSPVKLSKAAKEQLQKKPLTTLFGSAMGAAVATASATGTLSSVSPASENPPAGR